MRSSTAPVAAVRPSPLMELRGSWRLFDERNKTKTNKTVLPQSWLISVLIVKQECDRKGAVIGMI